MSEKLFLCLEDNGDLSLKNRFDTEETIRHAEEFDGNMPFTIVGTVHAPVSESAFLIIAKSGTGTIYDVIDAKDEEVASKKLLGRKRFVNKEVSIKSVRNIDNLIKEYYS